MAYLKPGTISVKVFNKLAMRTTAWGVHTLEVPRRSTGEPQRVPVIPVEVSGARYVVSTRGQSAWVANMRAAGRIRLGQKSDLAPYVVTEVDGEERSRALAAYRKKAGREVDRYFAKLPADADHPTFRVTPA